MPLLQVKDLTIVFDSKTREAVKAVDGVSFSIWPGEVVGLVGESGSGKSVTALSILNLISFKKGRIESGEILYKGKEILSLPPKKIRKIRGSEIAIIFQEPMTSLNPVLHVGLQITEVICTHFGVSRKDANVMAVDLLRNVGIPDAERRMKSYPHHLSGGMRQRVMISMALACKPGLLIADEPTTALDVTIQRQILDYLQQVMKKGQMSMLFISHDLGVIGEVCDRVMVMYAGRILETGTTLEIFKTPLHPYTRALVKVSGGFYHAGNKLPVVPGMAADLSGLPKGCKFHPRCSQVHRLCREVEPTLKSYQKSGLSGKERWVRCWEYTKMCKKESSS
ncbi:ABC transporter ATP-binding protein [Candidatus Contubernalis alkaliaceticus]|uniref:ABC transporter ATP-binding protein n=1 Tax=Candidatus Contubernalis alkaliaceticus TaxID=338645 RepID=UPI001F4BDECE|nr:ABC transporter ATP-binding protein [Candidatus Contubernalis alkalaceticus]